MAMMLSVLLPSVLLFVLLMFFMRRMNKGGGGMMGVGKSRAKAYVQKETGITLEDVAGQDEAKEILAGGCGISSQSRQIRGNWC